MSLISSVSKLYCGISIFSTLATKKAIELQNRPGFFDHPVYSYRDRTMTDLLKQISIIIRQLKMMSMQMQITSMIRQEQMVKGMTCRADLCK